MQQSKPVLFVTVISTWVCTRQVMWIMRWLVAIVRRLAQCPELLNERLLRGMAHQRVKNMEDYQPDDGITKAVENNITHQWEPKRDITVYELALCLPYLTITPYGIGHAFIDTLPEQARRHFYKVLPGVKSY
jgi:hypothetical protein